MNDPIEEALLSYPLAEPPRNFSQGVMQRIRPLREPVKFRLTWMDYALGVFLSSLPAVAFLAWASLPRLVLVRLQYQWLQLHSPGFEPVITLVFGALAVMLGLVFIAGLRFIIRPNRFGI